MNYRRREDASQAKKRRREKSELRSRMKSFMMFLPNMVVLLGRLLKDARVPTAEKALFVAAIIYVISPLDFIPDVFPFIGQIDDIYVVSLTLLRLLNHSDERIVREHWPGGGDIFALVESITSIAPILLPKRVTRILSSRVELAPAGRILKNIGTSEQVIVVEIPQPEAAEPTAVESTSSMPN